MSIFAKCFIFYFLLSTPLLSQWKVTDYGYISTYPIYGAYRWLPNSDKLISTNFENYQIIDLTSGTLEKNVNFKNKDGYYTIYSDDLDTFYRVQRHVKVDYPNNFIELEITRYVNNIEAEKWKDSIIFLNIEKVTLKSTQISIDNFNDSLFSINIIFKYGNYDDRQRSKTFLYNLKTKEEITYDGSLISHNPKSNCLILEDKLSVKNFNNKVTSLSISSYIVNLTNKKSYGIAYTRTETDYDIILGNQGKNFIMQEDGKKLYYFQIKDDSLIKLDIMNTNIDGSYYFSDNEEYLLDMAGYDTTHKINIISFNDNKKVDDFDVETENELGQILFIDKEFIYAKDLDGYLLKIRVPFFDPQKIEADFSTEKTDYFEGDTINFYDKSKGSPIKWDWDFGDGQFSSEVNPTHSYLEPGKYDVQLIIENSLGLRDTIKKNAYITTNPLLKADFEYELISVDPIKVKFTNTSEGEIVKYLWNFGDGNLENDKDVSHIYTSNKYKTTLTVFDTNDNFDQKVVEVYKDSSGNNDTNIVLLTFSTFSIEQLTTNSNLTDIEFFNDKIGIIVSDKGEIFRTEDGGYHWTYITELSNLKPSRIRILPNNDVLISSTTGVMYKSFDYGMNWKQFIDLGQNSSIIDFDCLNYKECYLLSKINEINKINEKGKLISKNEFEIDIRFKINEHTVFKEPLKAIIKNYDGYIVGTKAIYVDNILNGRYLHGLFKTKDFNSYSNLIDKDLLTLDNGSITEINKIDDKHILYSINNKDLYYYNLNYSYPPILILNSSNKFDKYYSSRDLIVLPKDNGDLFILDSLYYNSQELNFRLNVVHLDSTPLFDYFQVTPTKGIAIGSDGKYYITDFTTSVNEHIRGDEILVYPNPIQDEINVQFETPKFVKRIEVYGVAGNKVFVSNPSQVFGTFQLSSKSFSSGVFYLKIITNRAVFREKIIKF